MALHTDTHPVCYVGKIATALWRVVVVATLVQACSKQPDIDKQHKKTREKLEPAVDAAVLVHEAKPFSARTASNWTVPSFTKVIGFRFQEPEGHDDRDEFSLLDDNLYKRADLNGCAVAGKALTNEQVDQLLAAAFTEKVLDGGAACYGPHHIFIFYADNDRIVGAIEVCFGCNNMAQLPATGKTYEQMLGHHDFIALARLSAELGIWGGSEENLKEYCEQVASNRKPN